MLLFLLNTKKLSPFDVDSSGRLVGEGRLFELEGGWPIAPPAKLSICKSILVFGRGKIARDLHETI